MGRQRIRVLPPGRRWCLHCGVLMACKPRGLCDGCYKRSGVKLGYPVSGSGFARRSLPDRTGAAPLPTEPTGQPVGSEARFLVLEERAARGEQLAHPDDSLYRVDRPGEKFRDARGGRDL